MVALPRLRTHRTPHESRWTQLWSWGLLVVLAVPFLYVCVLPLLLLDLSVTIYQAILFPLYKISKVRRREYLAFERGGFDSSNALEKCGRQYCFYANGLLSYVIEIASRSEQRFRLAQNEDTTDNA